MPYHVEMWFKPKSSSKWLHNVALEVESLGVRGNATILLEVYPHPEEN